MAQHTSVSRAAIALMALLTWWQVIAAGGARAEQISLEAAATAAGLAVQTDTAMVNGVTIYYRDIGPRSEPVLLLHGFPETGDAFAKAAVRLGKRYRVIVPDLRGAGLSQRAASGYEKKTLATDIKEVMDRLGDRSRPCCRSRYRSPRSICLCCPVSRAIAEPHLGRGVHRGPRRDRRIQAAGAGQSANPALRPLCKRRSIRRGLPRQGAGPRALLHELTLEKPSFRRR